MQNHFWLNYCPCHFLLPVINTLRNKKATQGRTRLFGLIVLEVLQSSWLGRHRSSQWSHGGRMNSCGHIAFIPRKHRVNNERV